MKINLNNNKIKSLFLLSLVGSVAGKDEKTNNQTEIASDGININLLPQMAANLTKSGDDLDQILFFAGYPIAFEDQKQCVASFAVVQSKEEDPSKCLLGWDAGVAGFLTSARCCKSGESGNDCTTEWVSFPVKNISETSIGQVCVTTYGGGGPTVTTTDLALVSIDASTNQWQPIPYVIGNKELYPVIGLGSVTIGSEVCAYGVVSGFLCGNVVEVDLSIGADRVFTGLNKIENLGIGFYDEEDIGGPVYTVSKIGGRTVAQALGYITTFDNSDYNHRILYYTPLDKAFEALITEEYCYFTLMTYNESKTENLQAQIEIPPKN